MRVIKVAIVLHRDLLHVLFMQLLESLFLLVQLGLSSSPLPNVWRILKLLLTLVLAPDACRIVSLLFLLQLEVHRLFRRIYGFKIEVLSHQVGFPPSIKQTKVVVLDTGSVELIRSMELDVLHVLLGVLITFAELI